MLRSRVRLVRSCASRTAAGTFSALQVCSRTTPSIVEPVPRLEAAHAGLDVGIVDVGARRHWRRDRRTWSGAGAAPSPPDGGCRAAGGRLCATSGQPPLATMPSNCAIACSVCCTVAGDSVGSDAFGIWMVREPESKPWPKSLALVLVDQRFERRVLAERARSRDAAAGERGRLQAAQDGAPARMAVVRRIGHCSPRSPHRPRIFMPDRLFTRSQTRRARQVPTLQICVGVRTGLGEFVTRTCQTHQTPGGGNPGGLVAAEDGG